MPQGRITCSGARLPIHRRRRLHPAAASRDDKSAEARSLWPPVGVSVCGWVVGEVDHTLRVEDVHF